MKHPADPPGLEALLEETESYAAAFYEAGRRNNILDIAITISTIVTSLVAAVVAASDAARWIRVGIAAVPAACTSIQKVTEIKARSNWYFSYAARLRALALTFRYASQPGLQEFARKKAALDLEMEEGWRHIARSGAKPEPHLQQRRGE